MIPREVELPPMLLVGLKIETTQADLNLRSEEVWRSAGELELDKRIRHLKEPNVTLECQFNWHQTGLWTFMLAMEVAEIEAIPAEATVHQIPKASWLVFDLPGRIPNVNVVEAWAEIIEWFSSNNRQMPFLSYIQRYDEKSKKAQNLIQLGAV